MAARHVGRHSDKGEMGPRGSEPHYVVTPGKIMCAPAIFADGFPGNPAKPKMRGNAKEMGTSQFPLSKKNEMNNGPYKAFGIRGENQNGKGGKKGLGD